MVSQIGFVPDLAQERPVLGSAFTKLASTCVNTLIKTLNEMAAYELEIFNIRKENKLLPFWFERAVCIGHSSSIRCRTNAGMEATASLYTKDTFFLIVQSISFIAKESTNYNIENTFNSKASLSKTSLQEPRAVCKHSVLEYTGVVTQFLITIVSVYLNVSGCSPSRPQRSRHASKSCLG